MAKATYQRKLLVKKHLKHFFQGFRVHDGRTESSHLDLKVGE